MKIRCVCGHEIVDGAGGNPFKGHVIPDQDFDALMEAVDEAVMRGGEAACMAIRTRMSRTARLVWQCSECSRVYFDSKGSMTRAFAPDADEDRVPVLGRIREL